MNIRLQSLITIVPIFIGVGMVSGWLRYSAEQKELAWGLRSEAEGYALSLRSAVVGEPWKELVGQGGPQADAALKQIDRLLESGRVRRIVGIPPDGSKELFRRTIPSLSKRKMALDANAVDSVRADQVWTGEIDTATPHQSFLRVFAPLKNEQGEVIGALGVETDTNEYVRRGESLLREVEIEAAGAVILGLLCAWIIAQVLRRRIRELEAMARKIRSAGPMPAAGPGMIRELTDLKDSLQTMSSIMSDIRGRARRELLEGERFLSEEDLNEVFQEESLETNRADMGGTQIVCCRSGARSENDFIELKTAGDLAYVVFGRVQGGGMFSESLRESCAAGRFSVDEICRQGIEAGYRSVRELFALEQWHCLAYRRNSDQVELWTARPGTDELERSMHALSDAHSLFHNLPKNAEERVRRYVRSFHKVAPFELERELASLIRREHHGSLVVIGESHV
jgi:hypothetical protein